MRNSVRFAGRLAVFRYERCVVLKHLGAIAVFGRSCLPERMNALEKPTGLVDPALAIADVCQLPVRVQTVQMIFR